MRLLFIAILFTNLTTVVWAQKSFILQLQPKKGFVSLSAGVSLPTGDFANRSAANERAGLAGRGTVMNISAGYQVAGGVGLMGRFLQQVNGVDALALLRMPALERADRRLATAGQWTVAAALVGPYLSVPAGRFALEVRALAGQATAVCPANRIEGAVGAVSMSVQTSAGQAKAPTYGGGLTLSYRLGRTLSAGLTADYATARFTFADMTLTTDDGIQSRQTVVGGQRTISTLNVSGGLIYLFGNRYRPF